MKLVTTTGDLKPFYASRSVAAPLDGMRATGFTHIDLSFYTIVYKDSPWIAPGDAWKKEIEDAKRIARGCPLQGGRGSGRADPGHEALHRGLRHAGHPPHGHPRRGLRQG